MRRRSVTRFVFANAFVWLFMVVVLVVIPDSLERWVSLEIGRVIGWAVASGLWVIALQAHWRSRVGPLTLFAIQFVLWVSAALVAIWISDLYRF